MPEQDLSTTTPAEEVRTGLVDIGQAWYNYEYTYNREHPSLSVLEVEPVVVIFDDIVAPASDLPLPIDFDEDADEPETCGFCDSDDHASDDHECDVCRETGHERSSHNYCGECGDYADHSTANHPCASCGQPEYTCGWCDRCQEPRCECGGHDYDEDDGDEDDDDDPGALIHSYHWKPRDIIFGSLVDGEPVDKPQRASYDYPMAPDNGVYLGLEVELEAVNGDRRELAEYWTQWMGWVATDGSLSSQGIECK
jgi:hypothetical protein